MALTRLLILSIKTGVNKCHLRHLDPPLYLSTKLISMRQISSIALTKNLSLLSKDKKNTKIVNLKLEPPEDRPLVVMLSWLMARKRHIYKYADIYLKYGYDVLNVTISPWQLLWPVKGTQLVATDILRFIDLNKSYESILLHGFSVGGYLWGEVLVQMAAELQRYQPVLDRFKGQIWDSAADITEMPIGLPYAVFPKNKVMNNALHQYIMYHLKTFDKVATCHYIRSSQMFHTNLVKAPALFLLSKTDPIGAVNSNLRVKEMWDSMNIKVTWKCWDRSPHVGHFRAHPEEYMNQVNDFLHSIGLGPEKQLDKLQAKL